MLPAKDRDSSLFTQEYAKELFQTQENITYKDISRKSKAPQDFICMASALGKLKTSSCYLRDENHEWTLMLYSGEQRSVYL